MQFFIAAGTLLAASTAYLLHQFWNRELVSDEPHSSDAADAEPGAEVLRAA